MGESLRDQLLKSGLAKTLPKTKPPRHARSGKPQHGQTGKAQAGPARPGKAGKASSDDLNLAQAWAARARAESAERKQAEAEAEAKAKARKERQRLLAEALNGKILNKADAEVARHFEYAGKIRRVHVDAAQMAALNAGELGVVQNRGRYVVVAREVAEQVHAFAPECVALLVDPAAAAADDGVPDDLMW
ncbi:MAG TPA: DUF2058 family protein [Rhodanobacteraceae bacterium]